MKRRLTAATLLLAVGPLAVAPAAAQAEEEYLSLYDRLGGLRNIAPMVDDFVERLLSNPVLNRNPAIGSARLGTPPAYLKFQFSQLVCEMSGGPCIYSGQAMKESHQPLRITADEWEIMTAELRHSLEKFKVAPEEQAELLELLDESRSDIIDSMEVASE